MSFFKKNNKGKNIDKNKNSKAAENERDNKEKESDEEKNGSGVKKNKFGNDEKPNENKSDKSSGVGASGDNENKLTASLEDNIKTVTEIFDGDDTVVKRQFKNKSGLDFYLFYSDGLVNSLILNEHIMQPLLESHVKKGDDCIENLLNHVINISETKTVTKLKDIVQAVSYGDTVLLVENQSNAIVLNSKTFFMRGIEEPDSEKVISGSREGFTEVLLANLSLVKRRLRTENLKLKYHSFGKRTHTQACICYIDGLVNKEVLKELYDRLDKIDIDSVLDVNYLSEQIREMPHSLFRETGITEKPDVVVGKLLEGRIAVFVDGSPVVLTVPFLFIENFQSGDDYYTNYFYASISRLIRSSAFFLSIMTPAIYLAIAAFHKEMLPTVFFINVAAERSGVPFPVVLEMIIMFIIFDILREAGVRMPTGIGTALSIVGALVIGQAAVEARLVDAPLIIIVGFASITGLLNPRLGASTILLRLIFIILSGIFGLYGFILCFVFLLFHLNNLTSFGIPQLKSYESVEYQDIKDIMIRGPWTKMIKRPNIAADTIRMKENE